jgi:hypothetical protein
VHAISTAAAVAVYQPFLRLLTLFLMPSGILLGSFKH